MLSRAMSTWVITVVGMISPLICQAKVFDTNGTLTPPVFSEIVPSGSVVTGFSIRVDCAGISSVEHVPDGWSFRATADGENYVVQIERANAEKWLAKLSAHDGEASNKEIDAVRLGFLWRGEWSDCMSARAVVHVKSLQPSGDWQASDIWLKGSIFEDDWQIDPNPGAFEK